MMDVRLEDGTIIKNVPEGTTKAQLLEKIGQPQKPDDGFSLTETVKNIPSSAVQFGKDLVHPILNPKETVESLGDLATGLNQKTRKMAEGESTLDRVQQIGLAINPVSAFVEFMREKNGGEDKEPVADAVGKFVKDRYGSPDNFKKTLQEDPVGVLADASALLTLGGTTASKTAKLANLSKTSNTAKVIQKAGLAVEPINAALSIVKSTGKLIPQHIPEKLLESALKFRPSINPMQRTRMTRTALREGILPTVSGLRKITDNLSNLDTRLNEIINVATKQGQTIHKSAIFNQLKRLRHEVGGTKIGAADDLKHIDAVAKSFDEHLKSIKKSRLTPRELQDLKTDAYKRINFDLKQGSANFAKNETRAAIARSAKLELENLSPDVKDLNRSMGDLIELQGELEKVVSRLDNRNLISIDTPLKIAGGASIADDAGAVAGATASILGAPRVKARTALALENIRRLAETTEIINNKLDPALARQLTVLTGRVDQSLREMFEKDAKESK